MINLNSKYRRIAETTAIEVTAPGKVLKVLIEINLRYNLRFTLKSHGKISSINVGLLYPLRWLTFVFRSFSVLPLS